MSKPVSTGFVGATENAGVENAGESSRGGKCWNSLAVWKAESTLYSERALSYFLKLSSDF